MAIQINEKEGLFTVLTKNSMYQMKKDQYGVLLHTYYGKRSEVFDYSYLISYGDRGFSGNLYEAGFDKTYSLDVLPQEYSSYGVGDFRSSALKVRHSNGTVATELRYEGYQVLPGKYEIPGLPAVYSTEENQADTLVITLKDAPSNLYIHLYYGVLEDLDMITRAVRIENRGEETVDLEQAMSVCLDFQFGEFDYLTFHGRHAMERMLSRTPVHHGIQSVGGVRGTSSHHYNPFVILADKTATETSGECYGCSFLYSGDFLASAELDQVNQTRFLMGINPGNFRIRLEKGEEFWTPEAALVYSDQGLEKMTYIYHRAFRKNLCRGEYKTARRPVLLNNWEGTYFDFTGEKLIAMAKEAASMGVELFVMDDGWFGKRDDDLSGLGDWVVNEKKLGCTLGELSREIHKQGMKFGIWFEPEAVSEDSDLYREHPDWAYVIPGRKPNRARYQLVLDFSRKEVRDAIWEMMCRVLDNAQIDYLKWDFNRSICDFYSAALPAERQGETAHGFVLGLYDILERLGQRYPHILVEGCSGGGGRFDAGMLYYTPQIWTSDNTDAIERLKIQYGTSFCYPVSAMGAHVSAVPNHQTGRITPISTRATVAMSGTFGYELDPMKLTQEEKEEIKAQINDFKKYYNVIQNGNYYRLGSPYEENPYVCWQFVSEDGTEALLNVVCTYSEAGYMTKYVKLRGLKPDAYYVSDGERYLGAALMNGGFKLPKASVDYESWVFHFTEEQ